MNTPLQTRSRQVSFERQTLRAAVRFQSARNLRELGEAIVAATGRATPGELVYLQHFHAKQGKVSTLAPNIPWPFNPEEQQGCARLWFRHPLVYSFMQEGWFSPRAISEIVPTRRWREERIYNEVFRRNRFDYQQAVNFPLGGGSSCALVVMRSGLDFTDREQRAFELIRRMAVPALSRILRIERARSELSLLAGGADDLGVAIISLDSAGKLERLSHAAGRLLREHSPPHSRRATAFLDTLAAWLRECRDRAQVPQPRIFETALGRLRVRPSIGRFAGDGFLFIDEIERRTPPPAYARHGLSPRECDVLHGFVQGESDAALAARLGIGPRTVQEYAGRIFQKLHVPNRHAAAAWARRARFAPVESPGDRDDVAFAVRDPMEALGAAMAFQRHACQP